MDVDLDEVLEAWFRKSETSADNIDIDAFLSDAMFPTDFNIIGRTDLAQVKEKELKAQMEEEELGNIFKEDVQPDEFPLSCNMVSIPEDIFPCISCGRLFFSEENLENHTENCDNKEKKESCRHCRNTFARCSNKDLHERGCDKGKQRRKRHLKQSTIENYAKRSCVDNFQAQQVGGSSALEEHSETWKAPEILESTLKDTAMTYRKEFNESNRKDLLQRLNITMNTFTPIIQGEIHRKEGIKWYFSLKMVFFKAKDVTDLTDPPVTFRSEVFTSLDDEKLDIQYKVAYNQFIHQIEEFQRNGSGWVIHHFRSLDLGNYILLL